ncbi:MAG: DHH family phosphoesterase [Candidatus Riflebacteria bacterium]|nr:DHH family phosphoesterase [Candidatus Riflebacteria bacterium]
MVSYATQPIESFLTDLDNTESGLSAVVSAIRAGSRFLVVSHLRPDGDAVGCLAGLARSLRKAGKWVDIGLADQPPERFAFLLEEEVLVKPGRVNSDYDVIICLDAGDASRTGFEQDFDSTRAVLIDIDHHASNTCFGEINFLDFGASSTCEMITSLIQTADFPLDSDVAEGLYLGLATDSRFFQNENLRASAHLSAAALLGTGLDTAPILSILNGGRTLQEMKTLGKGLEKVEMDCDGRFAFSVLTHNDLAACGAVRENVWASGLFNQLTTIKGVIVSLVAVEDIDGKIFCEFRSRGGFDVKSIAVAMGGGGHLAASGCSRSAPLDDVVMEACRLIREKLLKESVPKVAHGIGVR